MFIELVVVDGDGAKVLDDGVDFNLEPFAEHFVGASLWPLGFICVPSKKLSGEDLFEHRFEYGLLVLG